MRVFRKNPAILIIAFLALYILPAFAAGRKSSADAYLEQLHSEGKERVIIVFRDHFDPNVIGIYHAKLIRQLKIINALVCEIPKENIDILKQQPNIKNVVVDVLMEIPPRPQPEMRAQTIEPLSYTGPVTVRWNNLEAGLNSKAAWDRFNLDGTGVKIAFLDTGINYNMEDLDNNYLSGYDFVDGDDDPMPALDGSEDHGTVVASIAVGEGVNKLVGVAYNASYYSIRVNANDNDGGFVSDVISGIEYASTEPHKVDIISMSLGTYGGSPFWELIKAELENACNNAYNNGIVVVASSGNEGYDYSGWPAAFDNVISVGGHGEDQTLLNYSGCITNGGVDIIAPGARVPALHADNSGWWVWGTSAAAPHAAGLIALEIQYARQRGIQVNNAYLWEVMKAGAKDLGLDPVYQGKGKIWAAETNEPPPGPHIGSIDLMAANWPIDYGFQFHNYAFMNTDYPVYYIGQDVNQIITLTNITGILGNTVETIENLIVTATQVYCGEPNEPNLPGDSAKVFPTITALEPGDANSITLSLSYTISSENTPGLKKTRLALEFNFLANDRVIKVSYNEPDSLWYAAIPGDLDLNNNIDLIDFAAFARHWQQSDCNKPDFCGRADIDQNGSVDFSDLCIFTMNWLSGPIH